VSRSLVAFLAGVLFACGLVTSQMTLPQRILGFLDFAGSWDPTLLFVMAGALAVYVPIARLTRGRTAPVGGKQIPVRLASGIDRRLVLGAVSFGVGWGLAGICPGPAVTLLGRPSLATAVFLVAMIGGMLVTHRLGRGGTAAGG
jgi:uncharacterized membrane protein YedE/YeeE